ncbi:MAG: hypothetical protein ACRDL2_10330 [Gaiellaceae bacterium]
MDELFDSAWMKWGWAIVETERLKADIHAWTEDADVQRLMTTRCEYRPNRHGCVLIVNSMPPLWPQIALRLSIVAHSYRSALDNFAWTLVSRGHTPPDSLTRREQRAISFPICDERDGPTGFNTLLRGTKRKPPVLPGVRRADRALVRTAQPYVHGHTNVPYHALWILAAFNNVDKHRTLQPVHFLPERFDYEIRDARDCEVTRKQRRTRRRILQIDAELAYFPVRRTGPNPELQVEYEIAAFPALSEHLSLEDWLNNVGAVVGSVLGKISDPPRELAALGLPPIVRVP